MATKLQDKLKVMASGNTSHWEEKALWRKENEAWLNKSASIALKVLRALRKQSMTQKELAERIAVSPQQVNKLLKGEENMCLDTICKLETALGIKLITIPNYSSGESIFSKKDSPAISHPKKYAISVESDNVCESVNEQDTDEKKN